MAIPEVTVTVQDHGLGSVPPSIAKASSKLGVCSRGAPNVVSGHSDITAMRTALGSGPLVEAIAQSLAVAGGPVYACPIDPTVAGTVGSVTHTGTGAGTVVPSKAPDRVIIAKITTGGAIATMAFAISVDGGAYGTPVTTTGSAPYVYRVPGTLTTLSFAAGTYVLNDLYTVGVSGAVVLTGTGPTTVTQASSPNDNYAVIVSISTGGALGTAVFQYSLDNGNSYSPDIAVPSGGVYTIAGTGIVLTFASTFVADDTYAFAATSAGYGTSDVTAAFVALRASPIEWSFAHVVGTPASAAATATLAGVVSAQTLASFGEFRFIRVFLECPTSESDATIIAAFANFTDERIFICATDIDLVSQITGQTQRRNIAWAASARAALVQAGEDLAFVGRGPLKNVSRIYRDEAATPGLDSQRFTTARTLRGKTGFYLTNCNSMASAGSDFALAQGCRVIDEACRIARAAELDFLSGSVRIGKTTGFIDERDAQKFEKIVNAQLKAGVVSTGDASDSSVTMSRTENILATGSEPVTVRVIPLGYLKHIATNIGFSNPALGA